MILLSRLDVFAKQKFFFEMQFGFQEGMGFTEASFTILETIIHLNRDVKFSVACLMFVKLLTWYGVNLMVFLMVFINIFSTMTVIERQQR